MPVNVYIGTGGMSVWYSSNLGENWRRLHNESGLYAESRVWALSCHPSQPGQLYAGTDSGIHRWDAGESRWHHMPSPMDDLCVWALAQAPGNAEVMIAGTHPAALFRSEDGGQSWRKLNAGIADKCVYIGKPRVTQLLFDPDSDDTLWCSVEIDGIYRSEDGGESWERRTNGLKTDDIHGLAVVRGGSKNGDGKRRILATTNEGLHVSEDEGLNWRHQPLDSPWQYTRTIQPSADGRVLFLTNGSGPPGSNGRLWRSSDGGNSWEDAGLPGGLNSTPWCVATNPADPDLIFTVTNLGQIFRSEDGGGSWIKLKRELGEIRAMVWQPA